MENLSSRIDLHTHAGGGALDNRVTWTFDHLTSGSLPVEGCISRVWCQQLKPLFLLLKSQILFWLFSPLVEIFGLFGKNRIFSTDIYQNYG